MLPFLKPKHVAGVIISQRKPESSSETEQDHEPLDLCAMDLIEAMDSKDINAVSAALRAAYEIMESEPEEMPESNDFESQNIKAARNER